MELGYNYKHYASGITRTGIRELLLVWFHDYSLVISSIQLIFPNLKSETIRWIEVKKHKLKLPDTLNQQHGQRQHNGTMWWFFLHLVQLCQSNFHFLSNVSRIRERYLCIFEMLHIVLNESTEKFVWIPWTQFFCHFWFGSHDPRVYISWLYRRKIKLNPREHAAK